MNFFKEINKAVDKINSWGNMTHQSNFLPQQKDQLTQLIRSCTYADEYDNNYEAVSNMLLKNQLDRF